MAVFDVALNDGVDESGGSGGAGSKDEQSGGGAAAAPSASPEVESALRKAGLRLIPLTMAIAVVNHMDRSK